MQTLHLTVVCSQQVDRFPFTLESELEAIRNGERKYYTDIKLLLNSYDERYFN